MPLMTGSRVWGQHCQSSLRSARDGSHSNTDLNQLKRIDKKLDEQVIIETSLELMDFMHLNDGM